MTMGVGAGRPATLGVGEDDLVTGDAVALQLPAVSPGIRIVSGLIDVVVSFVALVAGFVTFGGLLGEVDEALSAALALSVVVGSLVVLPVLVETLSKGRSLGRLIMGTVVVRTDGGPISLRQSVVRALVGFVEIWMASGAVALLSVLLTRRSQRLGDLAAGTCVVRDRVGLTLPPPAQPVAALEGWARSADIAPVPDALARSARELLARRVVLAPAAREALAQDIARALSAYVSPVPPAAVHPEDYVQTVLAELGRRDAARLQRDAELRARLGLG